MLATGLRSRFSLCIFVALLVLGASSASVAMTIAETTFDTDLDGWTFDDASDAQFFFEAADGNPGGRAVFVDSSTATNTPYIQAPTKFLGDWSAYDDVGLVSFDQLLVSAGDVAAFEDLIIRLDGSDGTFAVYRNTPPEIGATGVWITTEAPLVESDWSVGGPGSWTSLLADVNELRIFVERVENGGSRVETVATDNIRLAIIPEPGATLLLGIGLAGLACRRDSN